MALSIIHTPEILSNDTASIGTYTDSSSIISINATDYAALSTGSQIYITNNEAIGFWYVHKIAPGQITISVDFTSPSVYTFTGSGTFTFYFSGSNVCLWNAVHLPIIYKLQSTLWPINSVDTTRTVSSFDNDNGYVKLTLSGALKSDVTELEFLKITGASSGVYQIIAWYSTSILTINLAYSGSGMTFGSVQYYYNNYHARIKVYAGLFPNHDFVYKKPLTLITEQKVIPDSTGLITFNLNEFVKQQIGILNNNMLLGTLPNNIDSWCAFYIEYAEAYDYSAGGYTLLDYVSPYTTNGINSAGYAINSDLPFKNTFSGYMSDYMYGGTSNTLQKFLTPTLYPEIVPNYYFDISFIIDQNYSSNTIYLIQKLYLNGAYQRTVYNILNNSFTNYGVFRYSLNKIGTEDSQKIILANSTNTTKLISPSSWSDFAATFSAYSSKSSTQLIKTNMADSVSYGAYQTAVITSGTPEDITLNIKITNLTTGAIQLSCIFYDHDMPGASSVVSDVKTIVGNVNGSYTFTFNALSGSSGIFSIIAEALGISTNPTIEITVSVNEPVFLDKISETKTISINTGFFNSGTTPYTNYNICWLNYLGGFDWKVFQSGVDFGINIEGTKTVNKNIFQNWPNSFGEAADTIKQETSRSTRGTMTFRSENITSDQVQDLYRLKTSPLVQIVNAPNDKRTIIPDSSSFIYYKQTEKLFNFEFIAELTDNLPSQSL